MATHEVIAPAKFEAADRSLRRPMGFIHLLFLSLGAIIGSGWLLGSLKAASLAGPAAIISWAIGGVFVIFISLTYAEQAGMLPRTGAIVRYPQLTHGAWTGWLIGWTYWLSAITVPAIEAEAVVTYVGSQAGGNIETVSHGVTVLVWPNGILFFLGLMLMFFVLNFFGVRLMSETNRWVTWWKIIIPSLTAIFMFTILRGSNFTSLSFGSAHGFAPYGTAPIFEALSTTGVVFAYLGFRQALDYAGEARNPQRHVPLATILSVVIAMLIYVGLQIGFIGVVKWGAAGVHPGNWAGLLASPWAGSPLVSALKVAGVAWLGTYAWLLLVDAGISPSGTGWIYLGTAGRTNYGLSVNGNLPKSFQSPNRWGIPWLSMVVALIIGCIFVIPAPSWYTLVGFITGTTALTYIMGGVGLPVMRKYAPTLRRPFRLRQMWLWAPIGFLAAWMIVYWSAYAGLTQIYAAVFLGLPIFVWYYARMKGWFTTAFHSSAAIAMSLAYLGAWVYIQLMGGWAARIAPPASASWGFIIYFIAQCADVLFFCAALWLVANATGRRHVAHGMWLVIALLAVLPDSYYGGFGPEKSPPLPFPWGTLVAVGIGLVAFAWGVRSGFNTDELQEIVRTTQAAQSAPAQPEPGGGIAAS
ncbi:MAG: APC family permease [Nocardiopsaceae bacterium]|jgi:amino acid transporter|nr:APC family permease [Nocardiopsaceae bacterium]